MVRRDTKTPAPACDRIRAPLHRAKLRAHEKVTFGLPRVALKLFLRSFASGSSPQVLEKPGEAVLGIVENSVP